MSRGAPLQVPRPGARAARRRALVSTYDPRYQLATGHDPWEVAAESAGDRAPLTEDELKSLGLADAGLSIRATPW